MLNIRILICIEAFITVVALNLQHVPTVVHRFHDRFIMIVFASPADLNSITLHKSFTALKDLKKCYTLLQSPPNRSFFVLDKYVLKRFITLEDLTKYYPKFNLPLNTAFSHLISV